MRSRPGRLGGAALAVALLATAGSAPAAAEPTARDTVEACEVVDPSTFVDRPPGEPGAAVDCIAFYGITRGVTPREYRPATPVSRGQMASFLVRSADVAAAPAPATAPRRFPDTAGVHQESIDRLAAAGIAAGTADGRFHPELPVTGRRWRRSSPG